VFSKQALRIKKNHFFPLVGIGHVKHAFIVRMGSAQPCGLGFLAQDPNQTEPINKNKANEDQTRGFC